MLGILIDAGVLMFLLKMVNDDDIDFMPAAVIALVAAIGTSALAFGLVSAMGVPGIFVAALIAAAALGFAIAVMFGVELKRALMIAVIFMVVHIAVGLGFNALFSA